MGRFSSVGPSYLIQYYGHYPAEAFNGAWGQRNEEKAISGIFAGLTF
jgi:hypothetical protein